MKRSSVVCCIQTLSLIMLAAVSAYAFTWPTISTFIAEDGADPIAADR
jgi:hypothetical protein